MPDLIPKPLHDPPLWTDRALVHAVHVAVSVWWITYAVMLFIGIWAGYGAVSLALSEISPALTISMASMIMLGAFATLWGILTTHRRLDLAWKAHQAGLALSGFGWGVFTLIYIAMPGVFWYTITVGASQIVIAAAGFYAAMFVERVSRHTLRSQGYTA